MSIYREAPPPLLCPRCGDVLDAVVDLVRVCMQCEGVWLGPTALQAAFNDVKWPHGRSMWWRNSMACPECRNAGEDTQLTAMAAAEILVDRCPAGHGLYLDRGELGRLMQSTSDELVGLLDRLATVDDAQLAARRESWKRVRDERVAMIAKHGKYLEEVAARRRAEEAERKEERERQRAAEREAARQAARTVAQHAQLIARLRTERETLVVERRRIVEKLAAIEQDVASHETMLAELHEQRAELTRASTTAQLRLDDVVRQLAAMEAGGA